MDNLKALQEKLRERYLLAKYGLTQEEGGSYTKEELEKVSPHLIARSGPISCLSLEIHKDVFYPKWQFKRDLSTRLRFLRQTVSWDDITILYWLYNPNPFFREDDTWHKPLKVFTKTTWTEEERLNFKVALLSWNESGGQGW
jgi:hypothetical protein